MEAIFDYIIFISAYFLTYYFARKILEHKYFEMKKKYKKLNEYLKIVEEREAKMRRIPKEPETDHD